MPHIYVELSCREDKVLYTTYSRPLTGGIVKQNPGSLDIKDRSQSNTARAVQTVKYSAGITLLSK